MSGTTRNWIAALAVLICILEAFTKGWYSLFTVPGLFLIIPLIFFGMKGANRRSGTRSALPTLWLLFVITTVIAYVTTPGFGDTDDVLLFGFYATKFGPLADASQVIAALFMIVAGGLAVALLILSSNRTKPAAPSNIRS